MAEAKVNGNGHDLKSPGRNAYRLRESANNEWRLDLADGVTAADLEKPEFWCYAPEGVTAFDRIWAVGKDFVAEVLVRDYVLGSLQPVVMRTVKLPAKQGDTSARWEAKFDIFHDHVDGWTVRRKSDDHVMGTAREKGWLNKEEAIRYALDHASTRQPVVR